MIKPISPIFDDNDLYKLNKINFNISRGHLICVHISDIHFGVIDSKYQYDTLKEQFLDKIKDINFDILSINGDLFNHKFMSNSNPVLYSTLFISDCVSICSRIGATIIIIEGTEDHDSGQLKLFYHYLKNPNVDMRIVEKTKFEYVKGAKILCIPEEYGKGSDYYNKFLLYSGTYDLVLMHGMFKGAIYQDKIQDINSDRAPTFTIEDFVNCRGCIISGHVHTPGCFSGYFYYCGSPYRWQFGEEHDKGFLITLHNLDDGSHYVHFEKIISMKYITINVDNIINSSPKDVINYIKDIKEKDGIDYLRIEITNPPKDEYLGNIDIIKKYFRNNNTIKIKNDIEQDKKIIEQNNQFLEKYKEYDYILDKSLNEYEILTKYINHQKGYIYITTDELLEFLSDEF